MVLRIASIGYGDIAQRRHFPDIASMRGTAELVAIAGRDPAGMQACAARFGSPRCYTDAAEMLRDPAIDAVLVLTPPDSHAEFAEMAIRAGKHVLVEKPLVRTREAALRLRDAVLAQNEIKPVTCFALPHVGTAEHHLIARLLHAGAIGEVTGVEEHRSHRGPTHAGWFYRKDEAGGGVLLDLGIYQLTAIATLFGPAASMTALCSRHFDARTLDDGSIMRPDVEDSALISLLLESKVAVSVNANWNGGQSHRATRIRGGVFGREGMLHFGVADGAVYVVRPDGDYAALPDGAETAIFDGLACRKLVPPAGGPPSSPIREFVARIAAGDTSTTSLDIQLHVMDIVAQAYDSAAAGQRHVLPQRFR